MNGINTKSINPTITDKNTPIVEKGQMADKDTFLKILVGQLKNQDPLNPQDPTQYVTQLAQFTTLEQMMSLNDSIAYLTKINEASLANTALETASALVGKDIEVSVRGEDGKTVEHSGNVKSVIIKNGEVFFEVKLENSEEVKEFPYSSLVKVK